MTLNSSKITKSKLFGNANDFIVSITIMRKIRLLCFYREHLIRIQFQGHLENQLVHRILKEYTNTAHGQQKCWLKYSIFYLINKSISTITYNGLSFLLFLIYRHFDVTKPLYVRYMHIVYIHFFLYSDWCDCEWQNIFIYVYLHMKFKQIIRMCN